MAENALRLGDMIDDYCPRCKLLLNHAIASMMESQVVKVICKTCFTEHAYRHGEGGKRKVSGRVTLFEQVLARTGPPAVAEPPLASKPTRKKAASPAHYISRHKAKPPRKTS